MRIIHHVGYVVRDINSYRQSMPEMNLIDEIEDPIQRAKIALLGFNGGSCIELIEPIDCKSFTWNFLERSGEGMHHICYDGYKIDEVENIFREKKMMKVRGPVRAALFDRDVIFAISRTRSIIEFIL